METGRLTMIQCVFKGERLFDVQKAMEDIDIVGMTIWEVKGHGRQMGHIEHYRGLETKVNLLPKLMLEIVIPDDEGDYCKVPASRSPYRRHRRRQDLSAARGRRHPRQNRRKGDTGYLCLLYTSPSPRD